MVRKLRAKKRTLLVDGSILIYRDSTSSFVTTTDLSLSGTNYVTGGNF